VTYRAVARYPDAERIFLEVLAAKRETLGEKDRSTLTTINNLGNYYLTRKDFARAEEFFRTALDGRREVLGEEDEHTQISYSNVAAVLFQTKRYADALPLYQRAADGFTKVHTRDAPTTTLRVVRNQGICHARLGQREEAETLLLEVIDRSEKLQPGEKKVLLPDAAAELVRLYEDWGRPAAAAVWRVQLKEHLPVVREPAPPPRPAR